MTHTISPTLLHTNNVFDLQTPETLNKITDSILLILNLPYQAALPYLLGQPHTNSNREAVQAWLNDFLRDSEWIDPNDLVAVSIARIQCQLMNWQEVA